MSGATRGPVWVRKGGSMWENDSQGKDKDRL